MDSQLNEALTDVVRRWARPTTPEELLRRGVSRVRSVSLSRVANLIEKAVNRTLLARTIGGMPDDSQSFSEAARAEFVRMVSAPGRPDPIENEAVSALDRLKLEVAERRKDMRERQAELARTRRSPGERDAVLERRLREVFAAWGGDPTRPSPMEREVIEVAVRELQAERAEAQEQRLAEHGHEIELLERRIAKLSTLLGKTESDLKRMVARGEIDPGVASIYDTVQGLEDDDSLYAKKAALMSAIFEANLRMRDALAAAR